MQARQKVEMSVSQRRLAALKLFHQQVDAANVVLLEELGKVADRLQRHQSSLFRRDRQVFPVSPEEKDRLERDLSSVVGANPYQQLLPAINPGFSAGGKRVRVVLDPSISEADVNRMRTFRILDWKARPGTITAVHNGYDLTAVWAAGADGKPLPGKSGGAKVISIRLKR